MPLLRLFWALAFGLPVHHGMRKSLPCLMFSCCGLMPTPHFTHGRGLQGPAAALVAVSCRSVSEWTRSSVSPTTFAE
eukprot:1770734-Amphidinium_carterae.1